MPRGRKGQMNRWLLTALLVVGICVIATLAGQYFEESILGFGIGFGLFSWMLVNGLKTIPADPPNVGILTYFGRRKEHALPEGLHFFPIYPFVFGVILVDVTQKEHDMEPAQSFTPEDKTAMTAKISYTFIPDKDNILQYENANGPEGVIAILDDIVEEAFRERMANGEAPARWEEAVKMNEDFLVTVVTPILDLKKKPGEEVSPADSNGKTAGAVARDLRRGNGALRIPTLGIILKRLNVTDIRPTDPRVIEAAQQNAIENQQRKSEEIDANTFITLVDRLIDKGFDRKTALEAVQARRKEITRTIDEKRFSMAAELDVLIAMVASKVTEAVAHTSQEKKILWRVEGRD